VSVAQHQKKNGTQVMNVTLSSLARRKGVCCSAPKRISMQAVATTPHSNLEKEKE
jgi:hypothetical protein